MCVIIVYQYNMTKKLDTIQLQGKEYAQVSTRIKEFREMCPNGLIETTPTIQPDGVTVIFKTRILKDKSNPESGEATGHSMGKSKGAKDFEKLETISIGRALAILGFMASGEVASFDEMKDFLSDKEIKRLEKVEEIKKAVDAINDVEALREFFKANKGNGKEVDAYIMERANELKQK